MNAHVHRWRIDSPSSPTSRGVCDCGAERDFANSSYGGESDRSLMLNQIMTRPHLELADPYRQIGNVDRRRTR